MKLSLVIFFNFLQLINASVKNVWVNSSFPEDFLFGASTSAYQIEGGWNANGKGPNIWDELTHNYPQVASDYANADIACDSYKNHKEDVKLLKNLGVHFYRFSISWSRILPNGFHNKINPDGIRYYNELIDLLIENNIKPMVALVHCDIPYKLELLGGFSNDLMIDWFEQYARIAFDHFGDRVKFWLTFSDTMQICLNDCAQNFPPPSKQKPEGIYEYVCTRVLLKAHARAYHVYNNEYKDSQKGKVSVVIEGGWFEPGSKSEDDINAAQRAIAFWLGLFADPIYHPDGDYPEIVKKVVAERSKEEGFRTSRLKNLSDVEVEYIKGTADYFAVNHYTTALISAQDEHLIDEPSFEKDLGVRRYSDPSWPTAAASSWLKVVPWGIRRLLNHIKERYGNIEIFVIENGFSDYGELNDETKILYHKQYLNNCLYAIHEDKVNVKGYSIWSLIDNFEWRAGYSSKFGLYQVNFDHPERPRIPKLSAHFYKQLIRDKKITNVNPTEENYCNIYDDDEC